MLQQPTTQCAAKDAGGKAGTFLPMSLVLPVPTRAGKSMGEARGVREDGTGHNGMGMGAAMGVRRL